MKRAPVAAGVVGFVLTVISSELLDDHFGRITLGYQWATYGDMPFRDFFDPGLFGAAAWSAVGLVATRGSLLGEVILDAAAIGLGWAVTCALAARAARSVTAGVLAAIISFAAGVRLYDYDKVLSYPTGLWACWHYADRPSARRAAASGLIIGFAALLRYDTALYLGSAWAVTLLSVHRCASRPLFRDAAVSLAAAGCLAVPVLLWLHSMVGLPDAIDQIASYARIERNRSQLFEWTAILQDGVAREAWTQIMRRGPAAGFVYVGIAMLVPLAIAITVARRSRSTGHSDAIDMPHVLAAATLCALLGVFVLRDPLPARFGGVLPIVCVLAACAAGPQPSRRWSARTVTAIVACGMAIAVWQAGEIPERIRNMGLERGPKPFLAGTRARLSMLPAKPPALGLMPGGDRSRSLAWYLRQCTRPDDAVMVTWFGPHFYYFAQRRFAGGIWAFFGDHWVSDGRQRQVIARMRQRPPAIVVVDRDRDFSAVYALIAEYLHQEYRVAGRTDFDLRQDPRFQIHVPVNSTWDTRDPVWRLPCRSNSPVSP